MKKKRTVEKKAPVSRATKPKNNGWDTRRSILYLMLVIVLIAPWIRGMHHDTGRVGVSFLIFLVISIWLFCRGRIVGGEDSRVGLAPLLLGGVALFYLVGIISPAGTNVAINGALNWAAFLAVFWFWYDLRPTEDEKEHLLFALVGSSTVMALWGLLAYGGLLPDTVLRSGGRLSTAFYYPNATASMLMVGLLLALTLGYPASARSRQRLALVAAAVVMVPAFLLTLSRGAWLIFAVMVLLTFVVYRRTFFAYFSFLVLVGVAAIAATGALTLLPNFLGVALLVSIAVGAALLDSRVNYGYGKVVVVTVLSAVVLMALFVGIGAAGFNSYTLKPSSAGAAQVITFDLTVVPGEYELIGQVAINSGSETESGVRVVVWSMVDGNPTARLSDHNVPPDEASLDLPVVIPEGVMTIRVQLLVRPPATAVTFTEPRLVGEEDHILRNVPHLVLPYQFASRLSQMSATSLLTDARTVFYTDGFNLFKQAPVFGQGGGTWRIKYGEVQRYFYGSTHIHSDPYEVLLDTGLLGLAAFMAFAAVSLYAGFFSASRPGMLAGIAGLAILLHSLGEALMSFPAMYVTLFALLGVAATGGKAVAGFRRPEFRYVLAGVAVVLTLVSAGLYLAEREIAWYRINVSSLTAAEANKSIRRIVTLKPWAATQRVDLAFVIQQSDPKKAKQLLDRAAKLEPNKAPLLGQIASWYERSLDHHSALRYHEAALAIQPMNIQRYEAIAFAAATAMVREAPNNPIEAARLAGVVLESEQRFEDTLNKVEPLLLRRSSLPFRISPSFNLAIAQAHIIKKDYTTAGAYLSKVYKTGGDVEHMALLWGLRVEQLLEGDSAELSQRLSDLLVSEAHVAYWDLLYAATQP